MVEARAGMSLSLGARESVNLPPPSALLWRPQVLIIRCGVYASYVKPTVDRVVALVMVLLLLPVLVVITALVKWQLGSGVFFRQDRVGRDGRVFTIYKFRTMTAARSVAGADGPAGVTVLHKRDDDPRHTPLGRLLRSLSLDELPQLWNVLKGDMSLVGPRPEMVEIVAEHDLWSHPRHLIRPGVTGPWQVSQWRDRPLHEHLDEDLPYIERVTLLADLRIVAGTVRAVARRSGR